MRTFSGSSGEQWTFDDTRTLGQPGGFGSVHPASRSDGTTAAVKVVTLKDQPSSEALYLREVALGQCVSRAQPRHLIPLLDWGREANDIFLVMPQAERDLQIPADGLASEEAIPILLDIAQGLEELDKLGIVHRDLKPSNILLHEGLWKLSDFGMARETAASTQHPTFKFGGTPEYMAPERIRGNRATMKSDLYSLGCLAFELLTGQPPFLSEDDDEVIRLQLEGTPPSPPPSCPPVLRTLMLRLLNKHPAERPAGPAAVIEMLRAAMPGRELSPLQRAIREQAVRVERRRGEHAAAQNQVIEEVARRDHLARGALMELHSIGEAAAQHIRETLPALQVDLTKLALGFEITTRDVQTNCSLWSMRPSPVAGDTLIWAGWIMQQIWNVSAGPLVANVVYDATDGRFVWSVLRFSMRPMVDAYRFGPPDRPHGFDEETFFLREQRSGMITSPAGAGRTWTMSKEPLSAEGLLRIYLEALERI